jgi:aldehyde:ferredoxin oxidoreductase
MLEAALGEAWDAAKLKTLGERVWNQIRLFNLREGFTRADDTLPKRFTEEPLPEGPYAGAKITLEDLDQLLDDYYAFRGWDKEGRPTADKLKELGLENMPTLVERP